MTTMREPKQPSLFDMIDYQKSLRTRRRRTPTTTKSATKTTRKRHRKFRPWWRTDGD
jgi:hypothetical protein